MEKKCCSITGTPAATALSSLPICILEQGAQVGRREVRDAHLPTGDVSLNEILRVLINEMRVRPLRSDWESILT